MRILCDGHEYRVLPTGDKKGTVNLINNYGTIVAISRPAFGMLKMWDTKDGKEFKTYSMDELPPLKDIAARFVSDYVEHNPNHNA